VNRVDDDVFMYDFLKLKMSDAFRYGEKVISK